MYLSEYSIETALPRRLDIILFQLPVSGAFRESKKRPNELCSLILYSNIKEESSDEKALNSCILFMSA